MCNKDLTDLILKVIADYKYVGIEIVKDKPLFGIVLRDRIYNDYGFLVKVDFINDCILLKSEWKVDLND